MGKKTELSWYLDFVTDYEKLDFDMVNKRAKYINLSEQKTIQIYNEATQWANTILKD